MPLNLTDYDEQQTFEAMPPGKYFADIFDAEDRETQGGENAKMPEGTPMIFVHFMLTGKVGEVEQGEDSPYYNRRVFRNLVVPPADYDEKKRKSMNGMIVALYKAVGYSQEEITSGSFEVETEDLVEKKLVVQLRRAKNKQSQEWENPVAGFFAVDQVVGEEQAAATGIL
jgi:hypothetical protein